MNDDRTSANVEPALEAVRVTKRFGSVVALDDVSLAVRPGECVAVVGESGSGKTTLLRMFNRLVVPDSGEIRRAGRPVAEMAAESVRRSIGYVPQDGGLLPHWSVRRNVETVPWLIGSDHRNDRATRALERVGLAPDTFGDRWPAQLSGGQRQRVALARALATEPDVLLLDEPFGALDALTRVELQTAFRALLDELSFTAVLVTHDLGEAMRLGDRIAVLFQGRVEQVSDPDTLLASPATPYVRTLFERAGVA